ncbi:MAG: hypothetical protein HQK96_12940 [Nitrospirae bacterium]|nr:hypothetical protein [Nitrospirota bacterium]
MRSLQDRRWITENTRVSYDQIEVRTPLNNLAPEIIDLTTPLQIEDYTLHGRKGDSKPIPAVGGFSVSPYPWWPYQKNDYDCFHKERGWNAVYYEHIKTGNRIYLAKNWHYLWFRYNPALHSTLFHTEVIGILKKVIDNFCYQYNYWCDEHNKANYMITPYRKISAHQLYSVSYTKKIEVAIDFYLEHADTGTFFYFMEKKDDLHIKWLRQEPRVVNTVSKKNVIRDGKCLMTGLDTTYRGSHKSSSSTVEYIYGLDIDDNDNQANEDDKETDLPDDRFKEFIDYMKSDTPEYDDDEEKYDNSDEEISQSIHAAETGLIYRLENRLKRRRLKSMGICHPEQLWAFNPAELWSRFKFELPDYDTIIESLSKKEEWKNIVNVLQLIRLQSNADIRTFLKQYTNDIRRFMKSKYPIMDSVIVDKLTKLRYNYNRQENNQHSIIQSNFPSHTNPTTNHIHMELQTSTPGSNNTISAIIDNDHNRKENSLHPIIQSHFLNLTSPSPTTNSNLLIENHITRENYNSTGIYNSYNEQENNVQTIIQSNFLSHTNPIATNNLLSELQASPPGTTNSLSTTIDNRYNKRENNLYPIILSNFLSHNNPTTTTSNTLIEDNISSETINNTTNLYNPHINQGNSLYPIIIQSSFLNHTSLNILNADLTICNSKFNSQFFNSIITINHSNIVHNMNSNNIIQLMMESQEIKSNTNGTNNITNNFKSTIPNDNHISTRNNNLENNAHNISLITETNYKTNNGTGDSFIGIIKAFTIMDYHNRGFNKEREITNTVGTFSLLIDLIHAEYLNCSLLLNCEESTIETKSTPSNRINIILGKLDIKCRSPASRM